MPADCGVPVVTTLVYFFILHARLRVRTAHPAFPAPSVIEGHCLAKLGRNRAARTRVCGWLFEELNRKIIATLLNVVARALRCRVGQRPSRSRQFSAELPPARQL